MRYANKDIKDYAKQKKIYLYEVAEELCISEPALSRRFRKELNTQEKKEIMNIVDRLSSRLSKNQNGVMVNEK